MYASYKKSYRKDPILCMIVSCKIPQLTKRILQARLYSNSTFIILSNFGSHLHSITNREHGPARAGLEEVEELALPACQMPGTKLAKAPFHVCFIQKILQKRPNSLYDSEL